MRIGNLGSFVGIGLILSLTACSSDTVSSDCIQIRTAWDEIGAHDTKLGTGQYAQDDDLANAQRMVIGMSAVWPSIQNEDLKAVVRELSNVQVIPSEEIYLSSQSATELNGKVKSISAICGPRSASSTP